MARSSARNLVAGNGTLIVNALASRKGCRLVFSQAQSFKEGATIFAQSTTPQYFTIKQGNGTVWQTNEDGVTSGTINFRTTDPSPSRGRGQSGVYSIFVPSAKHFLYVSPFDASGNPDWYTYVDTVYPENGVHPYTKDRWTGLMWPAQDTPAGDGYGQMVPDVGSRVGNLDALPPVLTR
jgi:hypothetical protein